MTTKSQHTSQGEMDELGEEAADDAKIWREYVKESSEHDAYIVGEWNRTVDISLIFAALFSAVVAAFTIESYKMLRVDPQDVTNSLLQSILTNQSPPVLQAKSHVAILATSMDSSETGFTPSASAIWINALWFTSLTCSLGIASVGMLVKQWLSAYLAGLPAAPHLRAQVRQHRYDTLHAWYTNHIINCLPLALSLCLILFLSGLSILLLDLSRPIGIASLVLIAVTVGFHAVNVVLPAIVSNCPWKTAVSPIFYRYLSPLRSIVVPGIRRLSEAFARRFTNRRKRAMLLDEDSSEFELLLDKPRTLFALPLRRLKAVIKPASKSLAITIVKSAALVAWLPFAAIIRLAIRAKPKLVRLGKLTLSVAVLPPKLVQNVWSHSNSEAVDEQMAVHNQSVTLDVRAVLWLVHTSTKRTVVDCALQSLSGMPIKSDVGRLLDKGAVYEMIIARLAGCIGGQVLIHPTLAELYIRSLHRVRLALRGSDVTQKNEWNLLTQHITIPPGSDAYITWICARSMLNEIVGCLENHEDGSVTYSPFHLRLMIDTLAQELVGRKGPKDDHWVSAQSGGWSQISTRALPILIRLLNIEPFGQAHASPSSLDTTIAVCIAVLTKGSVVDLYKYADDERRREDFCNLILKGLSAILRFPSSHGCEDEELLNIVRHKYSIAVGNYAGNLSSDGSAANIIVGLLRVLLHHSPTDQGESDVEALLTSLLHMDAENLKAVDCTLFAFALHNITMLPTPPSTLSFHLLVCLERLVVECGRSEQLVSALIVSYLTRFITKCGTSPVLLPSRSQAFRLLGKIAYNTSIHSPSQRTSLIQEGLLDAVRCFFENPGSIIQEDIDLWISTLLKLSGRYGEALAQSRAAEAMINWSIYDWRGHELSAPHEAELTKLATNIGLQIEIRQDPTWFRQLISAPQPSPHLMARAV